MESNAKCFETEFNYDYVRHSLAETMVVLQGEPESTAQAKSANTVERKSKVIDPKIARKKLAKKEKKNIVFDYITAGTAAGVLGFAMMLGLGFKRA